MNENNKEKIEEYGLAISKGLIGLIPGIGPLTVELLNVTIPSKKIERVEKLLKILQSKVSEIEEETLKRKFNEDNFTVLYEDILHQAVRATSDERLEYLAALLEKGIRDETLDYIQTNRLLEIFSKVNDEEVIILQSYALKPENIGKFKQKHNNIFYVEELVLNRKELSEDDRKKLVMLNHYKDNLIVLGLRG
jgi:hypothetical protein